MKITEWNWQKSWNILSLKKEKGKVPSVLCVICGLSNATYKRPDGVYVIPITALKP